MRFCFAFSSLLLTGSSVAFGASSVIQPVHKMQSVVRVDAHSGRLVRAVVVSAKPVAPRVVAPRMPTIPHLPPARMPACRRLWSRQPASTT
jgi:hypothetical protein